MTTDTMRAERQIVELTRRLETTTGETSAAYCAARAAR